MQSKQSLGTWKKYITIERVSRYLLFFILAVLPLERIPAFHLHYSSYEITVRLSQIAGLGLILLNLPLVWRLRRDMLKSPWRWLVLFMFTAVLSAGLASELSRSILVTAFIGFDIALAWVISLYVKRDDLPIYFKILLGSGVLACLFGLYQFVGDLAGLPTTLTGLLPRYTSAVFGFPRIQSTGYEPLFFASYLLIPMSLAAAAFFWGKLKYAWALVLMLTIICLTLSRGAYAATAAMLLFLTGAALWSKQHFSRVVTLGAICILCVGLSIGIVSLTPRVQALFKNTSGNPKSQESVKNFTGHTADVTGGDSFYNRSVTWDVAIDAFKKQPVFGIGPGTFGSFAFKSNPKYFGNKDAIVNNEPLEILAEHGLIGLLAFLGFVLSFIKMLWSKRPTGELAIWIFGLSAALVGTVVQYQTFSTLYITHIWVVIGMLAGLVALKKTEA
jgi:hypothetical protein